MVNVRFLNLFFTKLQKKQIKVKVYSYENRKLNRIKIHFSFFQPRIGIFLSGKTFISK